MASSKKTKSGSGFFAKYKKYIIPAIIIIAVLVAYFAFGKDPLGLFPENAGTGTASTVESAAPAGTAGPSVTGEDSGSGVEKISESGVYTSKEDVALYLQTYGRLPSNFITKDAARDKGWSGGGLDAVAGLEGKCIGGDRFGNAEGLLPKKSGRQYYECDIDTLHAKERGAKRIVYSNDGLIYYTGDHYETFELLYGNP